MAAKSLYTSRVRLIGSFGPGTMLWSFTGIGLDHILDGRAGLLAAGCNIGRAIASHPVSAPGLEPAVYSFPYTVERKDRTVYFSSLRNDDRENFFGAVVS